MQNKILLGLVATLTVAAITVFALGGFGDRPTDPASDQSAKSTDGSAKRAADQPAGHPAIQTAKQDGPRTPVRVKHDASGADHPQGVVGSVVIAADQAVAGALVFLLPGAGAEPIAESKTDSRGAFRLGVADPLPGADYELRVAHPDYCVATQKRIAIERDAWSQLSPIELTVGVTLEGRVTAPSGAAIPGAQITARDLKDSPVLMESDAVTRSLHKSVQADESGRYTLRHLDPQAAYAVRASAEGYAPSQKNLLRLEVGRRERVDLQLTALLSIAGTVVDHDGQPVADARVTVAALGHAGPGAKPVDTDASGRFRIRGLGAGVYAATVEAGGFLVADEKPIAAGREDLVIALHRQGAVLVTVLDTEGQPREDFHASLRVVFADRPDLGDQLSNPLHKRAVNGSKTGLAAFSSVSPGTYVAEIHAADHARSRSQSFTVAESSSRPIRVTVRLSRGGTIVGTITDREGRPVAGAAVATIPDMRSASMLKSRPIDHELAKRSAVTSKSGEFRLARLYEGGHEIEIAHPNYVRRRLVDVAVRIGSPTALGAVVLERGCRVSGVTRVDDAVTGGVRVLVRTADGRQISVVSDERGRFALSERLPEGSYSIAGEVTAQANPLIRLQQIDDSRRKFKVEVGGDEMALGVNIRSAK